MKRIEIIVPPHFMERDEVIIGDALLTREMSIYAKEFLSYCVQLMVEVK